LLLISTEEIFFDFKERADVFCEIGVEEETGCELAEVMVVIVFEEDGFDEFEDFEKSREDEFVLFQSWVIKRVPLKKIGVWKVFAGIDFHMSVVVKVYQRGVF
jgi:hypothetical protein